MYTAVDLAEHVEPRVCNNASNSLTTFLKKVHYDVKHSWVSWLVDGYESIMWRLALHSRLTLLFRLPVQILVSRDSLHSTNSIHNVLRAP